MRPLFAPHVRLTNIGPAGASSLSKLANQAIVATTIGVVAEALLLAERGGADPARVREALLVGFADSTVLRQHGQRVVEGSFVPGGQAKCQLKNTGTALACAADLGLTLPILHDGDALSCTLVEHGGADLDHSPILLELRGRNGEPGALA